MVYLSVITFTEPIFYIQIYRSKGNTFKYIHHKKIADLCSENMFFLVIGIVFIYWEMLDGKNLSLITVISTILSFLSVMIILVRSYILRIKR